MSDPSLCAEIVWKIENFTYCWQNPLRSEKFIVNTLDKSTWYLRYYLYGDFYLYRAEDDTVKQGISVKAEIAVLDSKNEPIHVNNIASTNITLGKNSYTRIFSQTQVRENEEKYLQGNVFTIRCRMWLPDRSATNITLATLQTQISVSECLFDWSIERFSQPTSYSCKKIHFDSTPGFTESLVVTVSCLKVNGETFLKREVTGKSKENNFLKCDIYIPKTKENYILNDIELINSPITDQLKPLVSQKHIIDNSVRYLCGDTLLLKCKIVIVSHDIKNVFHALTLCKTEPFKDWYSTLNISSGTKDNCIFCIESINNLDKTDCTSCALKQDTLRMYREGTMSDFSIHVGSKVFPVHANILSSRSPVFHRMLETNMKEKNDKILKLDELDEDTVHQMLEYMYSDYPGELDMDSALKLYCMGDQYQMAGLKEISAHCLMQNTTPTNVCTIFQLADQHNDADLKSFAIRFIGLREKEVILSEIFETLCASNQKLCLDIFKELTKSRKD